MASAHCAASSDSDIDSTTSSEHKDDKDAIVEGLAEGNAKRKAAMTNKRKGRPSKRRKCSVVSATLWKRRRLGCGSA